MRCPTCTTPMTRVLLTVADQPAAMTSCGPCGVRHWEVGDRLVGFGDVLSALSGQGRARKLRAGAAD